MELVVAPSAQPLAFVRGGGPLTNGTLNIRDRRHVSRAAIDRPQVGGEGEEVRVRVDEPGDDAPALAIDHSRIRPAHRVEVALAAHPLHPLTHGAHQRRLRPRRLGKEQPGVVEDQVGLPHARSGRRAEDREAGVAVSHQALSTVEGRSRLTRRRRASVGRGFEVRGVVDGEHHRTTACDTRRGDRSVREAEA